jgi:hypothetical protein
VEVAAVETGIVEIGIVETIAVEMEIVEDTNLLFSCIKTSY